MNNRIGWNSGALVVPLAAAVLIVAAACSSSAAGGTAATAAPAAAAAAPVVASGSYGSADYGKVAAATAMPAASAAAAAGTVYEVKTATDAKAGTFLVGEDGKTLYVFTKDSPGKSVCSGDCATNWPPFTLDAGEATKAGAGVSGTIATITRADGKAQVTYNGAPVYYFAADTKAGDVTGQGVGGVWFAAKP